MPSRALTCSRLPWEQARSSLQPATKSSSDGVDLPWRVGESRPTALIISSMVLAALACRGSQLLAQQVSIGDLGDHRHSHVGL